MTIKRTSIAIALITSIVVIAILLHFENCLRGDQPYPRFDMRMDERHIAGELYFGEGHIPGRPLHAKGVAQSSNESLPFSACLIDMRHLPPYHARAILKENKSLDEIRREMWDGRGNPILRGSLVIGKSRYILTNISQNLDGNYTVLLADLLDLRDLKKGVSDQIAGQIRIETLEENGFLVGYGYLILTQNNQSYNLTLLPPLPEETIFLPPPEGPACLTWQEPPGWEGGPAFLCHPISRFIWQ